MAMDPCNMGRGSLSEDQRRPTFLSSSGLSDALSASGSVYPFPLTYSRNQIMHSSTRKDKLDNSNHNGISSRYGSADSFLAPPPTSPASVPIRPIVPRSHYHHYLSHGEHEDRDQDRALVRVEYGSSAPVGDMQRQPWRRRSIERRANSRRSSSKKAGEDGSVDEYAEDEERQEHKEEDSIDAEAADVDGEEEWLPPHELVARERAAATSGGGSAFSLCQGVGRTLKGRDLCRLRNTILKQTGFI
ncbi:hypothetical protein KP509_32G074900 [Ceratopteris richardii]|uniref:Senescence regulator n=1 Tax=Ceratopteris richardii TaxID=49495 RepID=A0A8T2QWJ1_CERRI|nr:hypothetical protein KP509_32G074900 [Ceratopteris richardii]